MEEQLFSGYRNSLGGHLNRCPLPFAFPFAPLSLGLFDTDPSRILSFLHHQTLLAEEALRYRGIFLNPKEQIRYNPLAELLTKEQDRLTKRSPYLNRDPFKYPLGIPDLLPASTAKFHQNISEDLSSKRNLSESPSENYYRSSDDTTRSENKLYTSADARTNSRDILDEILAKRGGNYLKDGVRFNPLSLADHHSLKEKSSTTTSSSASSSSSMSPSIKTLSEALLMQDSTTDEETKCNICNANFPSTWLLEQHTALQHSNNSEEKALLCDQYRSAFAKHRDQNQRARLPADKLFTCDVCGMQFRYLKSFKKHRLNHALERIHGKKSGENNNELVSSSNEALEDNIDLNGMIKDDDEEDEQNDIIDSVTRDDLNQINQNNDVSQPKISSTDMEISSQLYENNSREIGSIKVRSQSFLQKPDSESSLPTTSTINNLLRPDTTIGLNSQEASLLNFLRADAAEKQEKTPPVSRFACPFCGKCVRSKENLKLHVRKHTGERPFVCLFCGRAFGGKSDLTRHLRIHTGERPYHCEACGKCFARADYLSKHLTTHLHNSSR